MTMNPELVKMVAEAELMHRGVAKEQWLIGFSGNAAMEIEVHMNNATFIKVGTVDWRTLTPDDVRGMVRSLTRRVVELATTPKG